MAISQGSYSLCLFELADSSIKRILGVCENYGWLNLEQGLIVSIPFPLLYTIPCFCYILIWPFERLSHKKLML